jgi:hypothetical protein
MASVAAEPSVPVRNARRLAGKLVCNEMRRNLTRRLLQEAWMTKQHTADCKGVFQTIIKRTVLSVNASGQIIIAHRDT